MKMNDHYRRTEEYKIATKVFWGQTNVVNGSCSARPILGEKINLIHDMGESDKQKRTENIKASSPTERKGCENQSNKKNKYTSPQFTS